MKSRKLLPAIFVLTTLVTSCGSDSPKQLPIMGRQEYRVVDGKIDTVYHTIPDFRFVDQDSMTVTGQTMAGKIYVADFFFGTCPTICPKMKQQMLRVYEQFRGRQDFAILSHTIDPDHDTVAYLKEYATRIGVTDNRVWHFLTGDKDKIYEMGSGAGYMVPVGQDGSAPGGFIHSGAFILVDKEKRIRGYYNGTDKLKVDALINDIPKLLAEYE